MREERFHEERLSWLWKKFIKKMEGYRGLVKSTGFRREQDLGKLEDMARYAGLLLASAERNPEKPKKNKKNPKNLKS